MTPIPSRNYLRAVLTALCCLVVALVSSAAEAKKAFNIPAGPAAETLKQFQAQSGTQLLYAGDAIDGVRTNAAQGDLSPAEALDRMFIGTGLTVVKDKRDGGLTLRKETPEETKNGSRAAQSSDRPSQNAKAEDKTLVLDTFEVMGSKLLNMDVQRSRDDVQPYVIFDRAKIEQSGATNIEDFLKNRLPMDTTANTNLQDVTNFGNTSSINLRGLGTNQTLILIDGHRAVGVGYGGNSRQPDLNGIPMAAVERIDVLPATASGIYGGSATGGVINIILRRNYSGVEIAATYENAFNSDTGTRRLDLSAGFGFENGKTNVLITGSYADQNLLAVGDRDFFQRGRATILANNPAFFLTQSSPPIGATPNIRSSDGSNLVLKNGTPLGSPITYIPANYAGTSSDGGTGLVTNAGKYNFNLANSSQFAGGAKRGLVSSPTVKSFGATIRRQMLPNLDAFVEFETSENQARVFGTTVGSLTVQASAPDNPFNQIVRVAVPISSVNSETRSKVLNDRLLGGLVAKLPWNVTGEVDYTWNRSKLTYSSPPDFASSATTAVNNGTINIFRDLANSPPDFTPYLNPIAASVAPFVSTFRDETLRLSRPFEFMPGGPVTISAAIEHRDEILGDQYLFISPGVTSFFPTRSQEVTSGYVEAHVPIFSKRNRASGVEELEFQLSGRTEEYETHSAPSILVGATTPITRVTNRVRSSNPTVGFRYKPFSGVALRASYGTGFLPPAVNQLAPLPPANNGVFVDPRRGNTATGAVQAFSGGNPSLKPETSKSWSSGVILESEKLPGLRLSIDYTKINKRDNIQSFPGGIQALINNEALFPGRITRGANLPGDQPGWAGPITLVDNTSLNIARAEIEAFDVQLDYQYTTHSLGSFALYAVGTRQTHYRLQTMEGQPITENVGLTDQNPLKLRANFGLDWTYGRWKAGWFTRYFDGYQLTNATQILNQGNGGHIPSQMYHDAYVAYQFARGDGWRTMLGGCEVRVGVKNIFNSEPPVDVNNGSFYYSRFGDPHLATYFVSVKKQF